MEEKGWNGVLSLPKMTGSVSSSVSMSKIKNGEYMFSSSSITGFSANLDSLENGRDMFWGCDSMGSFNSNLENLYYGRCMFNGCRGLSSFDAKLGSLTNGTGMFKGCKLNDASLGNIAKSIKDVTGLENGEDEEADVFKEITIGLAKTNNYAITDSKCKESINLIISKGWAVWLNTMTNGQGDYVKYVYPIP